MNVDRKIKLLSALFAVAFLVVWLRLFYWQVVRGEALSADAEGQHFSSLNIPPKRGDILFDDGTELVSTAESFLLYAHLPGVKADKTEIAQKLSVLLAPEVPLVATNSANLTAEEKTKL